MGQGSRPSGLWVCGLRALVAGEAGARLGITFKTFVLTLIKRIDLRDATEGWGRGLVPPVQPLPCTALCVTFMFWEMRFQLSPSPPPPPVTPFRHLLPTPPASGMTLPSLGWRDGGTSTRSGTFVQGCVLLLGWWSRAGGPVSGVQSFPCCRVGPACLSEPQLCLRQMDSGVGSCRVLGRTVGFLLAAALWR